MKKFLIILIFPICLWMAAVKFLNPTWHYPWELFYNYPEPLNSAAAKSAVVYWESFRLNFPYHIQVIGVSEQMEDGSRTIIVAEPPSGIDSAGVVNLLGNKNVKIETKINKIGYDGWVKDIVIVLSGSSTRQQEEKLDRLYAHVFGSAYKPHYLDLTTEPAQIAGKLSGLNYSVSAAELNRWFLEDKRELFTSETGDNENSLRELLNDQKFGVYYSKNPGFVAWIIPRGAISIYTVEARKFAVDADLILGAVAGPSSIAVISRERQANIFALPPLRVETIMQLAAADKSQIAQSYERNNMFAGKLPGGMDWAPIYLSDDLINTEYGSLLNITDQLLKSWSQHGEVSYYNFMYKKPSPAAFPYKQAITKELDSEDGLTFNWNTTGAAYMVNYGDLEVAALNRTGSLPVTYIPDGGTLSGNTLATVRKCEDRYYDFFSDQNDPNLVRVVQYAALYQLFSTYGVTADEYQNVPALNNDDIPLNYTVKLLDAVQYMSAPEDEIPMLLGRVRYLGDRNALSKLLATRVAIKIAEVREQVGEEGVRLLTYLIAHPRLEDFESRKFLVSQSQFDSVYTWFTSNQELFSVINQLLNEYNISRLEVRDSYVASYNGSASNWIKTPSIVVSWSPDSAMAIGGHNIDARMLGVDTDGSLAAGTVRVVEDNGIRKVYVSADDVGHITPSVIRDIEVNGKLGIQQEGRLLSGKIRERSQVFPTSSTRERGFSGIDRQSANVGNGRLVTIKGNTFNTIKVNGQDFISLPEYPYILYPRSKADAVTAINLAMKRRRIAPGEFKVISFVEDATTTATLTNYCPNSLLNPSIFSVSDLANIFARHPRKTFHLVGHIEDGAIYMPGSNTRLPLIEIQSAAKRHNVNYTVIGCETAFVPGAGASGFVSKINSVEVAEALGMALETSSDIWTFTHTLAKNNNLKLIVYDTPLSDLGYYATQSSRKVMIIGAAAGTVIVVAVVESLATPAEQD